MILDREKQRLRAQKRAVARWLNRTLNVYELTEQNLLDRLDNGVLLCRLASVIQRKAEDFRNHGLVTQPLPSVKLKCWERARPESFYARDNTDNFIRWCRQFGVHEAVLFESDGLVLHSQPRCVVLCLLEVARLACRYGFDPVGPIICDRDVDLHRSDDSSDSETDSPPVSPVHMYTRTGSSSSTLSTSSPATPSPSSRSGSPTHSRCKLSPLSRRVIEIASDMCYDLNQISQISEGRYCIAGKSVSLRIVRKNQVVVRLGGGWDTLQHFLSSHKNGPTSAPSRQPSFVYTDYSSSKFCTPCALLQSRSRRSFHAHRPTARCRYEK